MYFFYNFETSFCFWMDLTKFHSKAFVFFIHVEVKGISIAEDKAATLPSAWIRNADPSNCENGAARHRGPRELWSRFDWSGVICWCGFRPRDCEIGLLRCSPLAMLQLYVPSRITFQHHDRIIAATACLYNMHDNG